MRFIGIIWDREPLKQGCFHEARSLYCYQTPDYTQPPRVGVQQGMSKDVLPINMVPDELEDLCFRKLMAAGCLFEELSQPGTERS